MTEPVKRKSRRLLCAALAFCTLFSCLTALTCFADDGQERYELPIISIHSAKGAESSTSYTDVTIRIENAEKAFCLEECDAAWKIHGRSSARNSKKSYNVRFPERTDLLGMGAAKKWVLVGNPYDKSLLRNKLMYDLSGAVGMLYPMESRFVELYVNDRYRGVYQLCEAPEIDRERVAIHPAREEFLLEILLAGRKSDDPVITTPEYHLQFTLNDLDYLPQVIFISFAFVNLVYIRELYPAQPVQFLTSKYADDLLQILQVHKFDIDILYTELTPERIRAFHDHGIKVNCWTCDDKPFAETLAAAGIDFISSNILEGQAD